ncbi:MAG: metallophosphoesterase [Deltaproteobacteria bacterium]|nr:metallophosphoesterase [Deltaproteobacteria bacterium]
MILFLLSFFLLYGGIHLFFYVRLKAAFQLTPWIQAAVVLCLLVLLISPILVRLSERQGYEGAACFLSYLGYSWMGVVFLFFVASLCLDFYRLAVLLNSRIGGMDLHHLYPSALILFLAPLLIAVTVNIYGYFEAINIRTEHLIIKSAKIPKNIEKLRIVQISDVHVGMIVREGRLERMMAAVKKAAPDILVSTGDLVDGQIDNIHGSLPLLKGIQAKYGKYAVTGNHEFYAGLDQALDFTRMAGFTVLRGEGINIAGMINIAGVDDPAGKRTGRYRGIQESKIVADLPKHTYTLLLKHQPIIDPEALGAFDLQLSGHTHKGQIFPFSMVTGLVFPLQSGSFNLPGGSRLYVSRGAGTWGPPVRFLSPPEITILDLIPE